jgi:hypothetical protein
MANESGNMDRNKHDKTNLSNEVLGKVRKVVWFGNIIVSKEVLIWVFGVIAITEEQLEKMEEAKKIQFTDPALLDVRTGYCGGDQTYCHKGESSFASYTIIVVGDKYRLGQCT